MFKISEHAHIRMWYDAHQTCIGGLKEGTTMLWVQKGLTDPSELYWINDAVLHYGHQFCKNYRIYKIKDKPPHLIMR